MKNFEGLTGVTGLKNLSAPYCGISNFLGLDDCKLLEFVFNCHNGQLLSLAGLENIDVMNIYCNYCSNLTDISALKKSEHKKLNCVSFRSCSNLEDVSPIGDNRTIKYLFLDGCYCENSSINYWSAIDEIVGLCGSHVLIPEKCYDWLSSSNTALLGVENTSNSLKDHDVVLENLKNRKNLTRLSLKNNSLLTNDYLNKELLPYLTNVEYLQLFGLSNLTSISFIKNMPNIKELDLRGTNIVDLTDLDNCTKNGLNSFQTLIIDNSKTNMKTLQNVINMLGNKGGVDANSLVEPDYTRCRGIILLRIRI